MNSLDKKKEIGWGTDLVYIGGKWFDLLHSTANKWVSHFMALRGNYGHKIII